VVQVVEVQVMMVLLMDQVVLVTQVIQVPLKVIQVDQFQRLLQQEVHGLVLEVVDLVALVQTELAVELLEQVDHQLQAVLQDHLLQELVVVEVVFMVDQEELVRVELLVVEEQQLVVEDLLLDQEVLQLIQDLDQEH
jgi:hypothetical protein